MNIETENGNGSILFTPPNEAHISVAQQCSISVYIYIYKLILLLQESASLADKLIQDQVTRAQEHEDTYALKNELSVTKQQLSDMTKKLEEAQDIIGDIKRRVGAYYLVFMC